MKLLQIGAVIWLSVSFITTATTWVRIQGLLRSHGPGVAFWDQWENLGRFRKMVRDETDYARKQKYVSVLRTHFVATASTILAFALFAWIQLQ